MPDKKLLADGKFREFEKQMRKHMVAHFLLWFISKKPIHGYDIIKSIEGSEGFRFLTPSQLYPLLKDLTGRGLIAQKKEMHGRRARKIYHVTAKGTEAMKEAKKQMRACPLKRQFLKELVE
ncbi:MAG TPA: PadR family transcriptional regulator [Candidatus Bilamarchaeum sp.]|nr:PadR family transcriptional regulator [Candidatus Bilamarchaeum sp.]